MKKGTTDFKKGDYIATIPFGVCKVLGFKYILKMKWYKVKTSRRSTTYFYVQEALIKGPGKRSKFS